MSFYYCLKPSFTELNIFNISNNSFRSRAVTYLLKFGTISLG
jgi:hypothetical protein